MDYKRFNKPLIDWSQTPEQVKAGKFDGAQSPKDCKKQTPDYKQGKEQIGFKKGDKVVLVFRTLFGHELPVSSDTYTFDSYDAYDNTCFITNDIMTYNVLLTNIKVYKDE